MTDPTKTVEARVTHWMAAWNESDEAERLRLVQQAWSGNGRYVDPFVDVTGADQIAGSLGTLMSQFPGHRVRRSSGIERHFDQIRFTWELLSPQSEVVSDGVDIAQLAEDNRFLHLTGFAGALVPVPLES